jgi:hypothetical protein
MISTESRHDPPPTECRQKRRQSLPFSSPNTCYWAISISHFSPEFEIMTVDRTPSDLQMRATLRRHALSPVNIDVNHTADSRLPRRFRHRHNNGVQQYTKPLVCTQCLIIEKLSSPSLDTFQHLTLKFVRDDLQLQSWVTTQLSSIV